MESRRYRPDRKHSTCLSPILLAAVLMPAFLQINYTCEIGDTHLSSLQLEVAGYDQIVAFDSETLQYYATVTADTVVLRAAPRDPAASVYHHLRQGGALLDADLVGVGGGEVTLSVPLGESDLKVEVRPPEGGVRFYDVDILRLPRFACSEQGILDAIAVGGGPHTFDCDGATTVTTLGEISIDSDVILDGEGNLTIDGNYDHRVLSVAPGITAELVGMTASGGPDRTDGAGILSEGTLTLTDSSVVSNGRSNNLHGTGAGIYNSGGTLTLIRSRVSGNTSYHGVSAIYSVGALMLIESSVSDNLQTDAGAIESHGTLTLIGSTVSVNELVQGAAIFSTGAATLINSTVSKNFSYLNSGILSAGTLTLLNSTIVTGLQTGEEGETSSSESVIDATDMVATNSVIVGHDGLGAGGSFRACYVSGTVTSGGGNIESTGDTCGLTDPTDLVNVSAEDLKLGPLQDNGGPTETHALLPGSVAIDHVSPAMCIDQSGAPLPEDQRGEPRPGGAMCDVGAFEVQP